MLDRLEKARAEARAALSTVFTPFLLESLRQRGIQRPTKLRVGVDENIGQWGVVETTFDETETTTP